jgi:hypothetical protein
MPDVDHVYEPFAVGYLEDHSIITDADSEEVRGASELHCPAPAWVRREGINSVPEPASSGLRKAVQQRTLR